MTDTIEISSTGDVEAYRSAMAPTFYVNVGVARLAYRRIGPRDGLPLIMLQRYQGTMDDWDPDLLDRLSLSRPLIIFDYPGIGRSTGKSPSEFPEFAALTIALARAIGTEHADVLGWSFSNFTASHIGLEAPEFVRRLILASGSPGYLASGQRSNIVEGRIGTTEGLHDDDYAFLFFPHTPEGRRASATHLARLRLRPDFYRHALDKDALACQLVARALLMVPEGSLLSLFTDLRAPTLVAHGLQDIRIPVLHGLTTAQAIPDARFIGYPRAAHAFLFEFAERFAADVDDFLS